MHNQIDLTLKPEFTQQIQNGYPLLMKEYFEDWNKLQEEGSLLHLYDKKRDSLQKATTDYKTKGMAGFFHEKKMKR